MKIKNILLILIIAIALNSCSKNDDNNQNNNPNIPNAVFDTGSLINTALSASPYGQLEFDTNAVYVPNYGINGIVVINIGNNSFSAFEYSDPNHPISACSNFNVPTNNSAVSFIVTCSCDDGNAYNILSGGIPENGTTGQFTLVRYNVEVNGSIIRVFNN